MKQGAPTRKSLPGSIALDYQKLNLQFSRVFIDCLQLMDLWLGCDSYYSNNIYCPAESPKGLHYTQHIWVTKICFFHRIFVRWITSCEIKEITIKWCWLYLLNAMIKLSSKICKITETREQNYPKPMHDTQKKKNQDEPHFFPSLIRTQTHLDSIMWRCSTVPF